VNLLSAAALPPAIPPQTAIPDRVAPGAEKGGFPALLSSLQTEDTNLPNLRTAAANTQDSEAGPETLLPGDPGGGMEGAVIDPALPAGLRLVFPQGGSSDGKSAPPNAKIGSARARREQTIIQSLPAGPAPLPLPGPPLQTEQDRRARTDETAAGIVTTESASADVPLLADATTQFAPLQPPRSQPSRSSVQRSPASSIQPAWRSPPRIWPQGKRLGPVHRNISHPGRRLPLPRGARPKSRLRRRVIR
jgi:hypothetical protein